MNEQFPIITYSRTIKKSKDYNSEAVSITATIPVDQGTIEDAYKIAKSFVDAKLALELNSTSLPPASQVSRSIAPPTNQGAPVPPSSGSGSTFQKSNGATEKQIKLLIFKFRSSGRPQQELYDKVKEIGAYCNFKDYRNNLTRQQFDQLLQWCQQ